MSTMKSILPVIAIVSAAQVQASSDFGNNNPGSSSPYFYSETINVYECENDVPDYNTDAEDYSDSASIVSSSLLYEGGCLVSSQAMMCNGGDSLLTNLLDFDSDQMFSDDEDEDDDDDDDGHSSMLSNSSLRRSKALADGSTSHSTPDREPSQPAPTMAYYESEVQLNQQSSSSKAALLVRGGSFASRKGIFGCQSVLAQK